MKLRSLWLCCGMLLALAAHASSARADALPPYMNIIVGGQPPSAGDTARQNVLALNAAMFGLYDNSGRTFRRNILAQHPVILALFSGAGGRLILYRPGMKSVGHATMVLSVMAGPHIDKPADQSWRPSFSSFRAQLKAALDGLDQTGMQEDWRPVVREILTNDIAFVDECLAKGVISFAAVKTFTETQGPKLKKIIAWAAETQVAHWMGVVAEWKKQLGSDWEKTYAASNTIYVARQNNILYSVLAQFFGPEAINSRLILLETLSFTTTPENMLEAMTRIIGDRAVGALFFGNDAMMDFELMGGNARAAIIAESKKMGMTPFLPPLVPFGSKQWPTLITSGPGPATLADLP
jgi:hypothetical protein